MDQREARTVPSNSLMTVRVVCHEENKNKEALVFSFSDQEKARLQPHPLSTQYSDLVASFLCSYLSVLVVVKDVVYCLVY